MGLEIFDKLWVLASEEIKDVAAVLKNFKQNDWERELSEIKEKKTNFRGQYKILLNEKDELQSKKKLVENKIRALTKKLKSTDKSVEDIDTLKQNKETFGNTLSGIDIQLGEVTSKTEKAKTLDNQLRLKLQYHKDEKTEENFIELENLESKKREFEIDLDKLKIEVRTKLDKIEKLGDLEYDEDCDYCMKNPFTLDAIETKKLVEVDKDRVKEHLSSIDNISYTINIIENFLSTFI